MSTKQALTFHANCLLRRQFAWNVKAYFLQKNKKNIINLLSTEFVHSLLSVIANIWVAMRGNIPSDLCPMMTQIIHAVWSESSAIQNMPIKDFDQTVPLHKLIWIIAGHTCYKVYFLMERLWFWYSLELSHQGNSNVHPHHTVLWRKKKMCVSIFLVEIKYNCGPWLPHKKIFTHIQNALRHIQNALTQSK